LANSANCWCLRVFVGVDFFTRVPMMMMMMIDDDDDDKKEKFPFRV